jgi:hypothetical protein
MDYKERRLTMSKDMLGAVVRKLTEVPVEMFGAIYDFLEKLAGSDGKEWLAEFKKFLRKEKCWADVVIETLLDLIGTVTVPARTAKFVAKDHFVKDTSKKAKVKISYLGDNFKENFLGKTEEAIAEMILRYYRLKKWSRNIPIINGLGGEDKIETTLAEMFGLMEMQPNGEAGKLLTNGYANIFFIRDANLVLWVVDCYWCDGGWLVRADAVGHQYEWSDDSQVFSRNSSESQS